MQRTSQNGGMGAALGGGAAESAFGSETNNILTKGTIYGTIAFFLVSMGLYLLYQAEASKQPEAIDVKELMSAEAVELSAEAVTVVGGDVDVEELMSAEVVEPSAETVTVVAEDSGVGGTIEAAIESVEVQAAEIQSEVNAAMEAVTTEEVPVAE